MTGLVDNDPDLVARLVRLFNRAPGAELIRNHSARMAVFETGDVTFPLSISDPPNGYLCSPTSAYIDYAIAETRHFANSRVLRGILIGLITLCRPLLRMTGLDRQVQLNNWLFSTNPVPKITAAMANDIRDRLCMAHPKRAIVLRSLNTHCDSKSMDALRAAGFVLLPARQIYVTDHQLRKPPSPDMKRDKRLLTATDYTLEDAHDFSADDFSRAAHLYHMLYVEKYSSLNPQYTPGYLAQAHQIGLLKIKGLRGTDGQLDGIVGIFDSGMTTTTPLIGYDTQKAQDVGLYRMLNWITIAHAQKRGALQNLSAGAASFKRNRNAEPAIEYTAVYVRHLGFTARAATAALSAILTWIGVPLMQRFKL